MTTDMPGAPDDAATPRVHRPRTIDPSGGPVDHVIRPRTVSALGPPEAVDRPGAPPAPRAPVPQRRPKRPTAPPVIPFETLLDPTWQPPTGPVPVLEREPSATVPAAEVEPSPVEPVEADLDPDIWSTDAVRAGDDALASAEPGSPPIEADDLDDVDDLDDLDDLDEQAAAPDLADAGSGSRLLRANLLVASGTAVSRLTGLVRTSLIIVVLGKGLNDAYVTANNTPNMIYELILGGILTASLVPLFTDDLERGDGEDATSAIISFALVALLVVTAAAIVLSPLLIHLFATGAPKGGRGDYLKAGVPLALMFAPQVFFYGLMAVWSAVLNSRHRFMAAAWAPVLNNIIAIATLIAANNAVRGNPTLQDALDQPRILWILGVGTTLGIVTMAVSLYPAIRRAGVRFKFKLQLSHPAVRRAIRLSGWTFGYVVANQIAVVVIQILAKPSTGDPTKYVTSYQWFQLPHSLLAVSIMVTFEPLLGRADARGDRKGFNETLLQGFRLIGLLIIPAAVGYIALPKGLDARTFTATGEVGKALGLTGIIAAFAVGLPGFSTYLYALRGFYAMKDTRIPFLINCGENAINIASAVVFVRWWGVVGLALSFALAYTVSAVVAVVILARHSPGFDASGLVQTWLKLIVAATVMGGFVYGVVSLLAPSSPVMLLPTIAAGIAVGAATYFASIYALQVPGINEMFARLPLPRRAR